MLDAAPLQQVVIRRLQRADAERFWTLRLEALRRHPEAFGSSAEEESPRSHAMIADRLAPGPNAVFGAMCGDELVGMAGFAMQSTLKTRHKGVLWGMYVRPERRGRQLGEALVRAVIDHARHHCEILQLSVVTENQSARALYRRLGFDAYGVEPRALKLGGRYLDEEMCSLALR
jgi:ribosomal protein S18 acetylase RimI-like enzyme